MKEKRYTKEQFRSHSGRLRVAYQRLKCAAVRGVSEKTLYA